MMLFIEGEYESGDDDSYRYEGEVFNMVDIEAECIKIETQTHEVENKEFSMAKHDDKKCSEHHC